MNTKETTPNAIPVEIYNELYDFLCDNIADNGECDEDGECHYGFEFESEDGHYYISGIAVSIFEYIDDSFDHAFGTEHCGHWEFDKLEEVVTEQCLFIDDEETREYIGYDSKEEGRTQNIISDDKITSWFGLKTQKTFEAKVKANVITMAEKSYLLSAIKRLNFDSYEKISFCQEHCKFRLF